MNQRTLGLMGAARAPRMADEELVRKQPSQRAAIALCIALSGLSNETICERLGIDPGHFSRISKGRGNMDPNKLAGLMELCGNYAPLQWMAWKSGLSLFVDSKAQRKAELLDELKRLEAA